MEIHIRAMEAADLNPVTDIYGEILNPAYISFSELREGKALAPGILAENASAIFHQQLVALLHSPSHGFFVVTVDQTVAGFALASVEATEAGHLEAWLDDIGVAPSFAHQGLGQQLIDQVVRWAQQQGACYLLLESGIDNKAHTLFQRLDFAPLTLVFYRPLQQTMPVFGESTH